MVKSVESQTCSLRCVIANPRIMMVTHSSSKYKCIKISPGGRHIIVSAYFGAGVCSSVGRGRDSLSGSRGFVSRAHSPLVGSV